jgi:hypothetical protein
MDAERFAQTIALYGYALLPGALGDTAIATSRAALDRLQAEDEAIVHVAGAMDPRVAASLSPRARRLLRVDTTPPTSAQAFVARKAARRAL